MIWTFTIPGTLPGTNEITRADRSHWGRGGALRKKTTRMVGEWIVAGLCGSFDVPVALRITWVEPNARRDIDNVSAGTKFILDALVQTRRIPDDSRKWVREITHEFPNPDPENPRIEIEIQPVAESGSRQQRGSAESL